ncbi:MAG TPA: rhodanese-like domain-containing protein [Chloroflexota bacterium]|nr:rhodanese-like domain-containing protein [Chloroflexota bacterium]
MFLHQLHIESLGHYSYLVASDQTGTAFVVDPKRDVQDYLDLARARQLRVTHIFETHVHNDYVSGARELAAASGARLHASADAALQFEHVPVKEGDEFRFGELLVRVLSTPGHTPEHVSYLVSDTARSDAPALIFTGGDLLVGSIGRPDLLGQDIGRQLAPQLFESLHSRILSQPDFVTVLPTHGAGSACGANLSSTRTSTIGYERITNPYLQPQTARAFTDLALSGQPTIPAYYDRMRALNQSGPRVLGSLPQPRPMALDEVEQALRDGAVLLDGRQPSAFGGAHIPGSFNAGIGPRFTMWVGSVVPANVPVLLVMDSLADVDEAVRQLIRVGYDDIPGYLAGGIDAWLLAGKSVQQVPQIAVHALLPELANNGAASRVLDVRSAAEWDGGHIAGAIHIPGGDLPGHVADVPRDKTVAIVCGSGYRSSVAASVLQREGFEHVMNVVGGMTAWDQAHYPITNNGGN